ncbi:potassium channel family protein [Methylobacter psychrophilus]|uniref:potassium channel family protein n=1 Tax=Methylobacter psychrophilus TaxID=96941 RepID=UPI0021D4AB94|nr:potassium channel family protein [Methylobacter psychrophilus]
MTKSSTVRIGRHEIGRFRFLLGSLMMMIGLRPLLDEWLGERIWADVSTDIFFAFALISGLHAISGQPRQLRFCLLLISTIIILRSFHYTLHTQMPVFNKAQMVVAAIFLVQMLIMIWVHIVKENEVTLDLIMAAACAYILLGMIWAYAYYFLESFRPDSFNVIENPGEGLLDFYYFSFVTLTTVGYGDILAVTQAARALSILEAITGQLYLAIMISRLVGLHASQTGNNNGK